MKKALLLILLFFSLTLSAQVSNTKTTRITNATTAFGKNIPVGTQIYNVDLGELWIANAAVLSTATLTTASASFDRVDGLEDITKATDSDGYNETGTQAGDNLKVEIGPLDGNKTKLTLDETAAFGGQAILEAGSANITIYRSPESINLSSTGGTVVTNNLDIYNGSFSGRFKATNVTALRSLEIPNTDGTIALEADASGFNGILATTDNTLQEIAEVVDDIVDTNLSIATTGEINTGTVDNKAISPLGFAGSQYATDITANNAKTTFPGFTSLLTDYGFTDDTGGDAFLANNQTFSGSNRFDPTTHNKIVLGTSSNWFTLAEKTGFGSLLWFANYDGTTNDLFARHATYTPIEIAHVFDGIAINSYVNNGDETIVGTKTTIAEISETNFNYLGNEIVVYDSSKKLVWFGDSQVNSLSYPSGDYPAYVDNKLSLTGTVTHGVSADNLANQIVDLDALIVGDANYFDDFDVCLLHIGVNDYNSHVVLGSLDDTSADATFIGQLKDFIEIVQTSNPEIEIYIVTPPEMDTVGRPYKSINGVGYSLETMAQAMVKVAAQKSVFSVDFNALIGMNDVTMNAFSGDDLHITTTYGKTKAADIIAGAMIAKTSLGNASPTDNRFNYLSVIQGLSAGTTTFDIENTHTGILTDQELGKITFKSNDASANGVGIAGSIQSVAENSGTVYGLGFSVKSGASEFEAMRIKNSGVLNVIKDNATGLEIERTGGSASVFSLMNESNQMNFDYVNGGGGYAFKVESVDKMTLTEAGDLTVTSGDVIADAIIKSAGTDDDILLGDGTTLSKSTITSNLVTHTSGLIINVKAFNIRINESEVTIPTANVTLPISKTHYIGYDLVDYSVHYLRRDYQDGMIWVAKVTTDGTVVTDIEQIAPILPCSNINNFQEKLVSGTQNVNIAILYDSLGTGTGGGVLWEDMLFNSANSSFGYNVTSVTNAQVDNYSAGAQTAHYANLWTGKGVRSGGGNYNNTGMNYDSFAQANYFDISTYKTLRNAPLFVKDYDLVIIGFGANGGTGKMAWFENAVKNIREQGIDVIITTQNFRSTGDSSTYYSEGETLKAMADAYGCGFADTWCFVKERWEEGEAVLFDDIHPTELGKEGYANAIRSVIHDVRNLSGNNYVSKDRLIKVQSDPYLERNYPNYTEIDCHPMTNEGAMIASLADDFVNPAVQYAGLATASSVIELEVGEVVKFSHPYATGYDIIYDASMVADIEWFIQNEATSQGTFSSTVFSGNLPKLIEGTQANGSGDHTANKAIQIKCTSGTAKIYGILWHTYKNNTLSLKELKLNGSWNSEAWDYSQPVHLYTDTEDDSFSFTFTGSAAEIYLNKQSAAGIVDVYLNGELIIDDQDLYSTGTYALPIYISPEIIDNHYGIPSTTNTVTVQLVGVNGSAITPLATNRRLGVLMVKEFNRQ